MSQPMEIDSSPAPSAVLSPGTSPSVSTSSLPVGTSTNSPSSHSVPATAVHPHANFAQQAVLAQAVHIPTANHLSRPVMATTASSATPATIAHTPFGTTIQPTTATPVAATPAILTLPANVSGNSNIQHAVRANIAHNHGSTIVTPATASAISPAQSASHTTPTSATILPNAIPAVPMAARPVTTAKAIQAVNVNTGIPWKQGSPVLGAITPPAQVLNAIPAASISSTSASTPLHPAQSQSSTSMASVWQLPVSSSSSSSPSNTLQTPQLRKQHSRSPSPKFGRGMTKSSSTSSLDSLANLAALASKAPTYSPDQSTSSNTTQSLSTTNPFPKFSITIPTQFNSLPNPAMSPLSALAQVVSQDSALGGFEFRTMASANGSATTYNENNNNSMLSSSSSILSTIQSDYPPPSKARTLSSSNIKISTRMRSPSNPLPSTELFHTLRHRNRRQFQRVAIENQRS